MIRRCRERRATTKKNLVLFYVYLYMYLNIYICVCVCVCVCLASITSKVEDLLAKIETNQVARAWWWFYSMLTSTLRQAQRQSQFCRLPNCVHGILLAASTTVCLNCPLPFLSNARLEGSKEPNQINLDQRPAPEFLSNLVDLRLKEFTRLLSPVIYKDGKVQDAQIPAFWYAGMRRAWLDHTQKYA
jgi:hypothetical protein